METANRSTNAITLMVHIGTFLAPVRQYAGPLDVERLVRWVATVKLLSRITILKGAQMMTATTQHAFALLMFIVVLRDPLHLGSLLTIGVPSEAGAKALYRRDLGPIAGTSFLGAMLASGTTVALLLWDRRTSRPVEGLIFAVLLFGVLSLSVANYMTGDFFVPVAQQALLDILLVFLGTTCLLRLWRFSVASESGTIIKGIAIFLIGFEAVFLPSGYAIIWLLVVQGAVSVEGAKSLNPSWLSALAGVGALALSLRKTMDEWRAKRAGTTGKVAF
jgi:hypothetical protein